MLTSHSQLLPYLDPRARIAAIGLLSWAHVSPSREQLAFLLVLSLVISLNYSSYLRRYSAVLVSTVVLLVITGTAAWLLGGTDSIEALVFDLARFLSLVAVSLALLVSMNAIELMSALAWFGLPRRIALALGIAFRFVPVFFQNATRLWWLHGLRADAAGSGKIARLKGVLPLLFVDVLRRMEGVMLAMSIQDIEVRLSRRRWPRLGVGGWVFSISLVILPILIIFH